MIEALTPLKYNDTLIDFVYTVYKEGELLKIKVFDNIYFPEQIFTLSGWTINSGYTRQILGESHIVLSSKILGANDFKILIDIDAYVGYYVNFNIQFIEIFNGASLIGYYGHIDNVLNFPMVLFGDDFSSSPLEIPAPRTSIFPIEFKYLTYFDNTDLYFSVCYRFQEVGGVYHFHNQVIVNDLVNFFWNSEIAAPLNYNLFPDPYNPSANPYFYFELELLDSKIMLKYEGAISPILYDIGNLYSQNIVSPSTVDLTPLVTQLSQMEANITNFLIPLQTTELNNLHEEIVELNSKLLVSPATLTSLNGAYESYADGTTVQIFPSSRDYTVSSSFFFRNDLNQFLIMYWLSDSLGNKISAPHNYLVIPVPLSGV